MSGSTLTIRAQGPGDLWYFPPGVPHSLQATSDSVNGTEFLLVFPKGDFSEDSTFLVRPRSSHLHPATADTGPAQLTDWMAHVPKDVLAKNFQTDMSAFDHIPGKELYIFPAEAPSSDAKAVSNPQGQVPSPYTFALSQVKPTELDGGSVRIADTRVFNVSTTISVAEVTVQPGAMRELHWHPTQDEWGYFMYASSHPTFPTSTDYGFQ